MTELIITAIREEVPGVKTFSLRPADGDALQYSAGQFLTFSVRIGNKELRRSYSLSSAPGVDDAPAITIKRVENGIMSRQLIDRAAVGKDLMATGPATGLFTLPEDMAGYSAIWLFAAGIGITPVYSLLKALLAKKTGPRIVLLYSNRSAAHTVFVAELKDLERRHSDRLRVVHLWSEAKDLRRARLSKESFPLLRAEWLHANPASALCYLCGPASYMWLVQLLLQDAGVPSIAVRREAFVVKEDIPHRAPADKGPHGVSISLRDKRSAFVNAYPQSILESAKAAGIALPYSCNAGQCGSCTAICTAGKVWMSYNEVLTERDIEAGRVLTCTGYAVDGDVALTYP